tara:strand:- start:806 stop:1027 length:222 start_codon:yes stop_codon:yes gene_type:complete
MNKEKVSSWELRQCTPEILDEIEDYGKAFIITRRDKISAVLINIKDFYMLEEIKKEVEDEQGQGNRNNTEKLS